MFRQSVIRLWLWVKSGLAALANAVSRFVRSWPRLFVVLVVLAVLMYYPLGGWLSEDIDLTEDYDLAEAEENAPQTTQMMAFLIGREVNQHIWTANLPIFFPSYFLDNMPNFQTGIISGLSNVSRLLVQQMQCGENEKEGSYMAESAKLLAYPGNVWLFSPDNKLKTAPSSAAQYRKARKLLQELGKAVADERCFWYKTPQNLARIVEGIISDLEKTAGRMEQQINEGSSDFIDYKADDIFYEAAGRNYAYYQLLKTLAKDYKQVLLAENLYAEWTKAVNSLQNAISLQPAIVFNGKLSALWQANHLAPAAYYTQRAENILLKIYQILEGRK